MFRVIAEAGQSPHRACSAGMSWLGCSFRILDSRADPRRAAELRPRIYRVYVDFRHTSRRLTLVAGAV